MTYPASCPQGYGDRGSEEDTGSVPQGVRRVGRARCPPKAQDGKVVHVPYTSLLNADGTPKPAKDIWSILAKAGISRYAELVCYSEDPGEAAANYFVLKLMGFPDVKVMVM